MAEARQSWLLELAELPAPRIAILAGGNSKSATYTAEDFHELGSLASALAASLGGSLLATTSPRTSPQQTDYLRLALSEPHRFHQWQRHTPNPYHAYLALADAVIVTGDSMSMCAEACGTGKPVLVYLPRHGRLAPKLQRFHQALFEERYAAPLAANTLLPPPGPPLNEAKRVAEHILRMLAARGIKTA